MRARRPDRVHSETTPCLEGGIGLLELHEAREASPDGSVFRQSGRNKDCCKVLEELKKGLESDG